MNAQTEHRMPFGRYAGQPLGEVPESYFLWALSACKLSSGLRAAIGDELRRRNLDAPTPPPLRHPPSCRCGSDCYRVDWQQDRRGQRRIRATCPCGRFLTFLPLIEPWISCANENASETAMLDALIELDDLGIELASDGHTAWIRWEDQASVPEDVRALVRQCSHELAVMLGKRLQVLP